MTDAGLVTSPWLLHGAWNSSWGPKDGVSHHVTGQTLCGCHSPVGACIWSLFCSLTWTSSPRSVSLASAVAQGPNSLDLR